MIRPILAGLFAMVLMAGCAGTQMQTYAKPATGELLYSKVNSVAVLPFDTLVEGAAAPKNAENILVQELLAQGEFERIEEPRYVAGLMKKLKLRNTETLDPEVVRKIGEELQVDALIVGSLVLYGEEERSTDVEFHIFLNMLMVDTGQLIWSGRTYVNSNTTWGQVFGLTEGPSSNEMAIKGMVKLAREVSDQFDDARDRELEMMYRTAEEEEEEEDGLFDEDEDEEEEFEEEEGEEEAEEILLKVKPK